MKARFVDVSGATRVRYWFRPGGTFLNAEGENHEYRKQGGFLLTRYEVELVDGQRLIVYTRKYGKAFWSGYKILGGTLVEMERYVGVPKWMKRRV